MINEWDHAANTYSNLQESSVYSLFNKQFVKFFVGDLRGKELLDAGCGDGWYSNCFYQQNALVTGCDGSSGMIQIARAKYPALRFDLVDLQASLPYHSGQFEVVFCNLVLMDVKHIEKLASEISRILKPGGFFFFSIVHPCFYLGDWEIDEVGKKVKIIRDYIGQRSETNNFWGVTTHYHRPISYYFNLFSDNGLFVKRLEEPAIPADGSDDATSRIPLFLFAKLVKNNL